MVLARLFQSTEIPITARNFMIDCYDSYGNHLRKPIQAITPPECLRDGIKVITRIRTELRQ